MTLKENVILIHLDNMAEFNEKTGEIVLTEEDKKILNQPLPKNWANSIINKIIWGDER